MAAELLAVVREEYGRLAYTFKTHQKMIDMLNEQIKYQKIASAVLISLTAGGTIDILLSNAFWSKVITLILSALALCLTIYQLSTNIDRVVDQHRITARALWLLREKYIHLVSDIKSSSIGEEEARKIRDELTQRVEQVYESAPDTNAKAYRAAKTALKDNEELTFSVKELDLLLPETLRELKSNP